MRLIDEVSVHGPHGSGTIQLFVGDLARIPREHEVDVLAVSAFPNSYAPSPGTLIEALSRQGVIVAELAANKEHDLRGTSSCWLSAPVMVPGFHARRVLCFEPKYLGKGRATEVVGDVFRSLVPFVSAEPWVRSLAMPLLASGNQREPERPMLEALVGAATHWMAAGLPLETLKIVLFEGHGQDYVDSMAETFRSVARAGRPPSPQPAAVRPGYDLFMSYAREDKASADALAAHLRELEPDLRIFVDRVELSPGSAWQQRIYDAVSSSRHILCLYSPAYLESKPCLEELNVGLLRNREEGGVLLPAYLRSAELPAYLRAIQYEDVREDDPGRLAALASSVIGRLGDAPVTASTPGTSPGRPPVPTGRAHASVTLPPEAVEALLAGHLELEVDITVRLAGVAGSER